MDIEFFRLLMRRCLDRFTSMVQDNRIGIPMNVFVDVLHENHACVLPQNLEKDELNMRLVHV